MSKRWQHLGVLVAAMALLAGTFPSGPARAEVPSPTVTEPAVSKPPALGGAGAATGVAKPGQEIVERRTAKSKTFATDQPDRFRTQIAGAPIHYRGADGRWADVDNTLVEGRPGRLRNKGGLVKVEVGKDQAAGEGLVRVELDATHSVAFSLSGARPGVGRPTNNQMTYSRVLPETDLEYTVVPAGVKEDIVLHSPAAPDRFVFCAWSSPTGSSTNNCAS